MLTDCGGANKYVCEYLAKIDEQSYVTISTDSKGNGHLTTRSTFRHNTEITTSKFHEDKARTKLKDGNHPCGRAVAQAEMIHTMLKYPESFKKILSDHFGLMDSGDD
eukprot:9810165-Ditylum_brightwellii.AAC.1